MLILEEYQNHLAFERQLAKNTIAAYLRDVKEYLAFCRINHTAPEAALPEFLDTYVYYLRTGRILAPSSVFRKMEAVKNFYKFLLIESVIKQDPTRFLLSPRVLKKVPQQLTPQEMERLLTYPARDFHQWRVLAIINLFYATGIRVSELINLRLENINLKEGWVLAFGKGGKQRFVPVNAQACEVVARYLDLRAAKFAAAQTGSEVFLNREGKKVSRIMVWKDIEALGRAAGITRRVHPHLFRHTFASHMLKGGADLRA
ncbi:MAG: tyrosine-type recombinase/integrase, partial [Elusimicrobiota bacterium]|nr:tyrosine-type recombinase/integrase [Elusimicrobiota bacterium]